MGLSFIKNPEQYLLNGSSFSKTELIRFSSKRLNQPGVEEWKKEVFRFILDWFSPEETISVFTSGSTGKPKEILIQKKHMIASAEATIEFFELKKENIALLTLPAKFIAGKMMIVRSLVAGLDLWLSEPSLSISLSSFEKKINFCAMIPGQVHSLLQSFEGINTLNSIEKLIIGGSEISNSLERQLSQLKATIWQTYGMTETHTHIALRKLNPPPAETFYKPMKDVKVSVSNDGCLIIDAEAIGVKSLKTNDLAQLENGVFRIIGRSDNVIISGGVKLFPEEIEKKLGNWIDNQYYISSLPDAKLGRKLVLYIEDARNLKSMVYQLWREIECRLSGYEIPKEIIFCDKFNRTENGKLIRA